jgi:hypothetical protein
MRGAIYLSWSSMSRPYKRVVMASALAAGVVGLVSPAFADDDDVNDTDWYLPSKADESLKPKEPVVVAEKPRPPYIAMLQLVTGALTDSSSSDGTSLIPDGADAGVSIGGVRVRLEQSYWAASLGAINIGDSTSFEIGAELNTGGVKLYEDTKQRVSLLTPAFGVNFYTPSEPRPGLYSFTSSILGVRYCRCVADKKPLVVDFRAPTFAYIGGASEEKTDSDTGMTLPAIDYSFQGFGLSLAAGISW